MLHTEYFTLRDCSGFLQIRSHIYYNIAILVYYVHLLVVVIPESKCIQLYEATLSIVIGDIAIAIALYLI